MKNWSIKKKIIIFNTLLFSLLIISNFSFLIGFIDQLLENDANNKLMEVTEEVVENLEVEDGLIVYEEDEEAFTYQSEGVLFIIYHNGLADLGPIPTGFDSTLSIKLNEIQTYSSNDNDYLVYDLEIEEGYVLRGLLNVSSLTDTMAQNSMLAIIIAPLAIVLSLVGVYWIITVSFKPLQTIHKTAIEIRDSEDYSKRIGHLNGHDEVTEMASMIDQMLQQVEGSISREKRFSSDVSHELRTPLSVLKAQAEMMLEKSSDAELRSQIQVIMSQIGFMERLVTQLLELTRYQNITDSFEKERIDLGEVIEGVAESFLIQMEEKEIQISLRLPKPTLYVLGDQTLLIRLFSNLLSNAIKYNRIQGTIDIHMEKFELEIMIQISDTGLGISQANLDKIFDPFYRVDSSRTQKDLSIGLGLAFVKQIVELHNGRIEVHSTLGKGTTFIIYLPA